MPKIQAGAIEISYETYGDGEPLLLIMGLVCPAGHGSALCLFSLNLNVIYFDNRGLMSATTERGER